MRNVVSLVTNFVGGPGGTPRDFIGSLVNASGGKNTYNDPSVDAPEFYNILQLQ